MVNIIDYFKSHPTDAHARTLMWIGLILNLIIYPIMTYIFTVLAKAPMDNTIQGQLAFSGAYLKAYYASFSSGLDAYRIGQILDYIFMFAYGSLLFALSIRIARNFPEGSRLANGSYLVALFAILAPMFDAVENIFILITLANPVNFPDWIAVVSSAFFSVPKWILLLIGIFWNIIARLLLLLKK
jgi:hypothetical protein